MKILTIAFFYILFTFSLFAQSNVDKLSNALDSLGSLRYNNWKVSPDLKALRDMKGDPTQAGFDDTQWQLLTLNQNIYPDSCWIRKEIQLPQTFLGQPVKGTVKILVSVDDYGYLWVNGESKGYFPWDGEFVLTDDAKPGQKFLIAIKAINTGGPLRLIRAELSVDAATSLKQEIEDFSLSMRVAQKLLSFDTYQTNARRKVDPKIDKTNVTPGERTRLNEALQQAASVVNTDALGKGTIDEFKKSLSDARTQLAPVASFVKEFTLYFDANAHIDAAWLWREAETKEVCKNTFASVFNLMNARQDFTYTQSAAAYYDWMEQLYPDIFQNIQKRVKDGRWEIVGGMWVEPDCNLPGGESWARHLLYSQRYFQSKFGMKPKIGWNPDSFGYNWNMPQFYINAGIDAFITQKIGWNDTNVFPYRVFWWEAPDGSRILSYFPYDYVNTIEDPYQLVDWLRQFEANSGFKKMMILFGVGDHGGGPSLEMLQRIDRLKKIDIFPTIEYGNTNTYLTWLRSQNLTNVPVWSDELYLEYHRGTYTTQAKMKEWNRKSEMLLTNAEKFSTVASAYGKPYQNVDLEEAWRKVLFNQFHDILPGSGIRENYIDATEKYQASASIGEFELNGAVQAIADKVNTSSIKKGMPALVFNALSWERNEIVNVNLPEGDTNEYSVFDLNGKEIVSQSHQNDKYHREVMFKGEGILPMGYKMFELRKQKPTAKQANLMITSSSLENQFFKITVDPDSGWIKSITDKRNGKELLAGYGNKIQILEDRPRAWDAWNIGLTGVEYPSTLRKIEIVEEGPVRAILRITRDYLKPGTKKDFPTEDFPTTFITQDIILYDGIDRIDFKSDIDWWEAKTMLKVAFPLTVSDTIATYEIPYGSIKRSTQWRNSWDSAKVEVPAQRWADLSNNDYGVSLLNKSKYGYDIKGNTIRLSLLRSPEWPDKDADRGKHSIEYSLYPHSGRVNQSNTVERGYEFNNPLIAMITTTHKGTLPASYSFVQIQPANVILTSMKKAEDSDAWIIQWYESEGEDCEATLTLPKQAKSVLLSNFLEEDDTPLNFVKNVVKVRTTKNSIVTVKVQF